MKVKRPAKPPVPREADDTIRHQIVELLRVERVSAKDISAAVRVREKEVYDHLDHIRRSLARGGERLSVTPPECAKCGFVFEERERLTPPGKCPVCRHEAIIEPLFAIDRAAG